jgi:hypothetical protein
VAKPYVPVIDRLKNNPFNDIEMSLRDTTVDDYNGTRLYEGDKVTFIEDNNLRALTNRVYEIRWWRATWMKYYEPDNQYSTIHGIAEYLEKYNGK